MIVSRSLRTSTDLHLKKTTPKSKEPDVGEFIKERNYTGAIAVLEFYKEQNKKHPQYDILPWLGYCAFHLGDYEKAMNVYKEILSSENADKVNHLYLACCMFFLGMYKEAEEEAEKGPDCPLKNRLLFHISDKLQLENKVMQYHQNLTDSDEDQLSLAAIYFLRNHFQEATEIYKKILLEKSYNALNVYVALCYYKMDYYDISLDMLNPYLQSHPLSSIAVNLKACNHYKLFSGKAAEAELQPILDIQNSSYSVENPLISHNLVVFRNGENALQVLPPLIDIIPEARLNLIIYYLRNDDVKEAYKLCKDMQPMKPQEYILLGVVNAMIGQKEDSREHLKRAQQYFQSVGTSASECDTIPGRQCMASCFFILKQFDDVLIYLKSIKSFFKNDDDFLWNYGIALAASGNYKEAEEVLLSIQNEKYKQEYCYKAWLARCYIMNSKPGLAWDLYVKMGSSNEALGLVQLIANDCYKTCAFYYAAKAFDVLERLDPNPEYWDGKRGACVGVFQQILARQEPIEVLREIIAILRHSNSPQVDFIIRVMRKWASSQESKKGI